MKQLVSIFLLVFSSNVAAQWMEYASRPNGDVYFYDASRIDKQGSQITVWTRVRYKTSVMAASSYQSQLKLDCSENSETEIQSTFFTDKAWTKPAMATNTNSKPTASVKESSTTAVLIDILCEE